MNRFDIKISKFEDYGGVYPIDEIKLSDWLNDHSLKSKIDLIRALPTKAERDAVKCTLPAVTLSGTFSYRSKGNLKKHSGLLAFDVDKLTPKDLEATKSIISCMPYTLYCATSVSGLGLWGLFEISNPDKHKLHFEAMEIYFKSWGIDIDTSCKDITRLRGYSFDLSPYINEMADVFDLLPKPVKTIKKPINPKANGKESVFDIFNRTGDVMQLLVNYGYKYLHSQDKRHRFTRPGKEDGVSVDWHEDKRVAYFFTSSTEFEGSKGFNAVQVFYTLTECKDWKECAEKLNRLTN